MNERALTGIRILDLTQFEAGSAATLLLGWLGADVIKVEGPGGESGRRARPWEPTDVDSIHFLLFNANKRSLVIDLKQPEGRDIFLRLVRVCDVVLENFAPGLMEKLHLDYGVLKDVNRRIIMVRVKGFGLSGPYRDYKGFDFIAQASGGVMSANGYPDREPLRVGAGIGDTGTGVHTALAILAAYVQRERTGLGQLVEVSMQEVATNFLRQRYLDHYRFGSFAPRTGNEFGGATPAGVYPCAPGGPNDYVYIYVQPTIERMWADFARGVGRDDLMTDPRFKDARSRYEHRSVVDAITTDWTSRRTKWEAMRHLAACGVACSAVLDTAEVLDDPHLNERGAIVTVEHPTRTYRMPGCPIRLAASPVETTPPPMLGQHTGEVLAELLGMSEAEVGDLRTRRVVV